MHGILRTLGVENVTFREPGGGNATFQSLVIRDLHQEHRPRRDIYQFVDNPDSIFLMDVDPTSMREVLQAIVCPIRCTSDLLL